ncbi:hypothetical protein DCAR_0935819 [Daucus carota subsp. sativus]|uniref:Uncharacterized protein n=1 Tax=Daucus carota subsp. sativus TaxID=79200 RepID=A0A175YJE6_DAUCS|nr:hypothetical protein DCAR_0935819 [Daucus carota subsp. sativus]
MQFCLYGCKLCGWGEVDFVRLDRSTSPFFNFSKPETTATRWNRVSRVLPRCESTEIGSSAVQVFSRSMPG